MAKKKKSNTPRRKRMKRSARLQSAKNWISKYEGKNLVRGYKKYYGVDLLCAAAELEMLGIKIDQEYVKKLKQADENNQKVRERKRFEKQKEEEFDLSSESNEYFYFIAGETSGGLPYGITWEEYYASQFYYIGGYTNTGKPYGITWDEYESSMPKVEYREIYKRFMSKQSPFDE